MKIVRIKNQDNVRSGRTIVPNSTDKAYVFDVVGDLNNSPNQFFCSIKVTYADNTQAALFMNSGDILEIKSEAGTIVKLEAYYNLNFRVML